MVEKTKFGSALGSIGSVSGLIYSMKNCKGIGQTFLFTLGFGITGLIIGNSISKFYE
jgi:hypothetical protein